MSEKNDVKVRAEKRRKAVAEKRSAANKSEPRTKLMGTIRANPFWSVLALVVVGFLIAAIAGAFKGDATSENTDADYKAQIAALQEQLAVAEEKAAAAEEAGADEGSGDAYEGSGDAGESSGDAAGEDSDAAADAAGEDDAAVGDDVDDASDGGQTNAPTSVGLALRNPEELSADQLVPGIPGGTLVEPEFSEPPQGWIPLSGDEPDIWGTPYTVAGPLLHEAPGVQYNTNHGWELLPGTVLDVTWRYGSFPYFNGALEQDLVHNTYLQQIWIWGAIEGGIDHQYYSGLAAWGTGSIEESWVEVSYDGSEICKGQSAELVPGMDIHLVFHHVDNAESNSGWGIGAWDYDPELQVMNPPDCMAP